MAEFMGTEECILYSYDLATVPSVIPAFANAKDIIVCDEVGAPAHAGSLIIFVAQILTSSPMLCVFSKLQPTSAWPHLALVCHCSCCQNACMHGRPAEALSVMGTC